MLIIKYREWGVECCPLYFDRKFQPTQSLSSILRSGWLLIFMNLRAGNKSVWFFFLTFRGGCCPLIFDPRFLPPSQSSLIVLKVVSYFLSIFSEETRQHNLTSLPWEGVKFCRLHFDPLKIFLSFLDAVGYRFSCISEWETSQYNLIFFILRGVGFTPYILTLNFDRI